MFVLSDTDILEKPNLSTVFSKSLLQQLQLCEMASWALQDALRLMRWHAPDWVLERREFPYPDRDLIFGGSGEKVESWRKITLTSHTKNVITIPCVTIQIKIKSYAFKL